VKPSSLGDIVQSLPFLHVLRRGFPEATIAWVVGRPNLDVLSGHPDLDEVIVFERERWGGTRGFFGSLNELSRFARTLRKRRFDLVVDLQGLLRSGLLSYVTGAPERVGFANAREMSRLFYNRRVEVPNPDMHAVDRYLLVAKQIGLDTNGPVRFDVPVPKEAERFARDYLASANGEGWPVVVLLPVSRWPTKRWPPERFAALADRVAHELGAAVLFLGAADDVPLVEHIRTQMKQPSLSLVGRTTLKRSAALLRWASVVVANDSGPMHLAVVLGVPVVALYGPTSPERTGPYGGRTRVFRSTRECAPCFRSRCDNPECMRDIAVDDVFGAVGEFMESKR